jgi:hypothetical protein
VLWLLAALWAGCADESENPIAFEKDPRTRSGDGPFRATLASPAADTFYRQGVSTAAGPVLMVGNLEDGFKARAYIRFASLPDTATVRPDSILSVTLTLLRRDRYGLESAPLQLFAGTSDWDVDSLAYLADPGGVFISEIAPEVDTACDTTRHVAPVDPWRVRAWLRDPSTNYGLFVSSSTSDAMVRLFSSDVDPGEQTPSLTIRHRSGADADSVVRIASEDGYGMSRFRVAPGGSEEDLEIGDGIALRALVRFDQDSLLARVPRGATLNQARLVLSVTDTLRFVTCSSSSMGLAAHAVTSSWREGGADSTVTFLSAAAATATCSASAESVVFEIGALVQEWVDGERENEGILLRSTGESAGLARIRLASREAADPALRPRLHLIYTVPPGPRP